VERILRACILGALLSALAPGVALAADNFDALMAEAVKAKNAGDYERTANLLKEAYRLRPAPELMNNLGKIYEGLGRYTDAVDAYSRVVATADASKALKDLDRRRIAALEPKLTSAWLEVTDAARLSLLRINGDPVRWTDAAEVAVAHGAVVLETSGADDSSVRLNFTSFERGRLHRLVTDLSRGWSALKLSTLDPRPERLTVNGYGVLSNAAEVDSIQLEAGRYAVEVKLPGHVPVVLSIALAEGDTVDLATLVAAKNPRAESMEAPSRARPSESAILGPTLTASAGLIAAVLGAVIVAGANADRREVQDVLDLGAAGEPLLGMSQEEAFQKRDDANSVMPMGVALVGVGAAGIGGALLWWLLDDVPNSKATVIPTPDGVAAVWRF
jgi:hypothetical protein